MATTRKTTATPKRRPAAKKPDLVVKSSAGPLALNRRIKAGDLFDLADAEEDEGLASLRVIQRIFRGASHDDETFARVRELDQDEMKSVIAQLVNTSETEDGAPAGESSGS